MLCFDKFLAEYVVLCGQIPIPQTHKRYGGIVRIFPGGRKDQIGLLT